MPVGLHRLLQEPLPVLVLHEGLRQPRQDARVPGAQADRGRRVALPSMSGPSSVSFRVRDAGPGDVAAIERVRVAGWRAAYQGLVPEDVIDRMRADDPRALASRRAALAKRGVFALLAEDPDGRAAGFCVGGPDRDTPYGGEIYALYVRPEHWSSGLGRDLLGRGVAGLRARGHTEASLWVLEGNGRARRFYERAGLTATGERRMLDIGGPVPELRYRIDLEVSA
ncbi:MAG: GNAT family N-acetyltransferase [Streptosporangiales bacterium]|nr:GNAT family N-acetyltransferase [Streptosporangiales bacterium]